MTLALPAINGSWQPESVGFCFTPAGQAALQPQLWYRVQLFRPVQPPVRSQSAAQPTQVEVTLTTRTVDLGFCRTTITTVRCKRPNLLPTVYQVTCGVSTTLSRPSSGLSAGISSSANTSRPAAANAPLHSASTSAASSTTPPREVLTGTTSGFIRARAARSSMPAVFSVSGRCTQMSRLLEVVTGDRPQHVSEHLGLGQFAVESVVVVLAAVPDIEPIRLWCKKFGYLSRRKRSARGLSLMSARAKR